VWIAPCFLSSSSHCHLYSFINAFIYICRVFACLTIHHFLRLLFKYFWSLIFLLMRSQSLCLSSLCITLRAFFSLSACFSFALTYRRWQSAMTCKTPIPVFHIPGKEEYSAAEHSGYTDCFSDQTPLYKALKSKFKICCSAWSLEFDWKWKNFSVTDAYKIIQDC
jgi:hypothetical protein